MQANHTELMHFTTEIVSAYVANNPIRREDLPGLISATFAALSTLGGTLSPLAERKPPAVSIKKSITPDYLISLEDGRLYKALKRHLAGLGMTPSDYRAKWGLPPDYPMVAPNYAKQRSELAKALGLGRKDAIAKAAVRSENAPAPASAKPKGNRAKRPVDTAEA